METNGFNAPRFETSSSPEDSKNKSKSKKKKSAAAIPAVESAAAAPDSKKVEVADKGKSLWERLVGDDKTKLTEKPDKESVETNETDNKEALAESLDVNTENDPSLEVLTAEEDAEITRQLVTEQLDELESGRDAAEAPAEAEAREAAIAMLQEMQAETPESSPDDLAEMPPEGAELNEPDAADEAEQSNPEEPIEFDDDTQPIPINPTKPATSSKGGAGSPPTLPPTTPTASSSPPPSGPRSSGVAPTPYRPGSSFNVAPIAKAGEHVPDYRTNPNASYLLAGGIVGYLIGRRRGRIKTEKRMKVVQAKLEKQVEAKQQEITQKTDEVKRLTREKYDLKYKRSGFDVEQVLPLAAVAAETVRQASPSAERQVRAEEVYISRQERPFDQQPVASERSKTAESKPDIKHEVEPKTIELEDKDVLRLSETITIGATNLRKVYEAKLVTRSGLRRLVNEHLQGKDIRRGLAREFLAKELSYERDPRFRDMLPPEATAARTQGVASQPFVPVDLASADDQPSASQDDNAREASVTPLRKPRTSTQKAVSTGLLTVLTLVAFSLATYAVLLSLSD